MADHLDYEPVIYESPWTMALVRGMGACFCVMIGFVIFAVAVASIPVPGLSDAPMYTRNMLYAGVGHHFSDVQAYLNTKLPPPSPPSF